MRCPLYSPQGRQVLKKCLYPTPPCSSLVTSTFLRWPLHGSPHQFPISASIPYGTHLRPHWKRLGAPLIPAHNGSEPTKPERGKEPLRAPVVHLASPSSADWMLQSSKGIMNALILGHLPSSHGPVGKLMPSAKGCRLCAETEHLANEFTS